MTATEHEATKAVIDRVRELAPELTRLADAARLAGTAEGQLLAEWAEAFRLSAENVAGECRTRLYAYDEIAIAGAA